MRSEEIKTFINYLKEEIQLKFGSEVAYAKDCQILSRQILEVTKRQLSESTLKRFFGIVESPFSPSKFTLDTLAVYLDFANWQDFMNSFETEKHTFSQYDSWKQLKNRVDVITDISNRAIKIKEDALFAGIPLREFADSHFQSFLDAHELATAFVAPGGYGKTTLIAQLTEKYFTGEDAKYPDDIICLIDGSILYNLITQNVKINRLYQLFEYDPRNSFSNYFRENPEKVKGRFVLIIDGFNELGLPLEKLNQFIGNLMTIIAGYENVDWFKMVITCRPDIWKAFCSLVKKNQFQQSKWYNVSFDPSLSNEINVPLLDEREIRDCSNKIPDVLSSYTQVMLPAMNEIFKIPLFVHLLQTGKISHDSPSEFELLKQYICEVFLSGSYRIERTDLLKSIVLNTDKGRMLTYVPKDKLFSVGIPSIAYNEMVSYGILKEFTLSQNFLDLTTYVEFSHRIVFEFLVANKWIEEKGLNRECIEKIYSFYQLNPELRDSVLKFIIQYAFQVGESDLFEQIIMIADLELGIAFPGLNEIFDLEKKNYENSRDKMVPVEVEA